MIPITVIFGKEQVSKVIKNIPLLKEELELHKKTYTFESYCEAKAFIKGINEAVGWQEVYVIDELIIEI